MTKSLINRLTKAHGAEGKSGISVRKRASSAWIKLGLVAAVLFALGYAVETKAIFTLESSQGPFDVNVDRGHSVYP